MGKEELPHFNFHEALLKPFESLLRLELCDEDVQDQVREQQMTVAKISRKLSEMSKLFNFFTIFGITVENAFR